MADKRVLYVEDDPDMVVLVRLVLRHERFTLLNAESAHAALELARRERPDLILLDLMLPDMDGWEVFERLRANETTQDIPVVVFSADPKKAKMVGADGYLVKPFSPPQIIQAVREMIGEE